MPQRSKITALPPDVKAELDRRLVTGGFAGYEGLAEWLRDNGFDVSRSAVHRYGQEFEDRIASIKIATEQAKAITDAVGDDAGATGDALIRLIQEKAFQVLVKMTDLDPESIDFNKLTVGIAKLNTAAVAQKKWQAEAKKKADRAVEAIERKVSAKTLDPAAFRIVKEEIYGIVS